MKVHWKKIKSTKILDHPRIKVFEDKVELPTGHVTDYVHFGDMPDATGAIVIRGDGKILVQNEYSYPQNDWLYHFPGGLVEKDETPEEGMKRELAEEAGLKANRIENIGWFYMDNRRRVSKLYVFAVSELSDTHAEKDIEEDIEAYWLTPQEIDAMISRGEITVSNFLSTWAIYRASLS